MIKYILFILISLWVGGSYADDSSDDSRWLSCVQPNRCSEINLDKALMPEPREYDRSRRVTFFDDQHTTIVSCSTSALKEGRHCFSKHFQAILTYDKRNTNVIKQEKELNFDPVDLVRCLDWNSGNGGGYCNVYVVIDEFGKEDDVENRCAYSSKNSCDKYKMYYRR